MVFDDTNVHVVSVSDPTPLIMMHLPLVVVSFVAARKSPRCPLAAGAAALPSSIVKVSASLVSSKLWTSSVFFVAILIGTDVHAPYFDSEGEGAYIACWGFESHRIWQSKCCRRLFVRSSQVWNWVVEI
jgi:hypothetical protein